MPQSLKQAGWLCHQRISFKLKRRESLFTFSTTHYTCRTLRTGPSKTQANSVTFPFPILAQPLSIRYPVDCVQDEIATGQSLMKKSSRCYP